jgi:hypothetical protein
MSIWPVIKAPIAVQLNRIAFATYAGFFGYGLWRFRHTASVMGTATFLGMFFLSLFGLFYSCVRARRARWIMAVLGLLIPGLVFVGMCCMEWSRPEGWWEWLFTGLYALAVWFGIPIMLAVSLFLKLLKISVNKKLTISVNISADQMATDFFKESAGGGANSN